MKMEIRVLGCGGSAGVPMVGGADEGGDWGVCDPLEVRNRRTRSSILIQNDDARRLLVDTGPDLRSQLLAQRISRFDAVLYTHAHADHIAGLDELRAVNREINRPLDVYGTQETLREVKSRFDYAFRPWTPPDFYRPVIVEHFVEPSQRLTVAGLELHLFEQTHGRTTSIGFRIQDFAYCTDVVELSDAALDALSGVDTWMVDCFQREEHFAHAWLARVLEWRDRIGARRTILTHLGTDMDWSWMENNLPAGVEPAFDGMRISFS